MKNMKILVLVFVLMGLLSQVNAEKESETVIVYTLTSIPAYISLDGLIKVGVGLLATLLFAISLIVYRREGRFKYFILMLAFLLFMSKGLLGLIDLIYPGETSLLLPFSDTFDFLILLLFFISVLKD